MPDGYLWHFYKRTVIVLHYKKLFLPIFYVLWHNDTINFTEIKISLGHSEQITQPEKLMLPSHCNNYLHTCTLLPILQVFSDKKESDKREIS